MPKGSGFKRAFKLKTMLKRGCTIPEIRKAFGIKRQSAKRMIDEMGSVYPVYESGYRHHRGCPPAIIYELMGD